MKHLTNRRNFVRTAAATALGGAGLTALTGFSAPAVPNYPPADNLNILGPREGYTPHIGTLLSMMDWMRFVMLNSVKGMRQPGLDYLLDENSNTIGAMLYHLAATDKWYQLNTFEGIPPQDVAGSSEFEPFRVAMNLGDEAREQIKGNDLDYYLDILESTREETRQKFAELDDEWLMEVDENFWGGANNYCKWFHVCEHESNHNGQIKLIKSRIS